MFCFDLWCAPTPKTEAAFLSLNFPLRLQAVCRNNVNTVKFLLDCGVDLTVRDLYGFTPLRNAEVFENREMVGILQTALEKKNEATVK